MGGERTIAVGGMLAKEVVYTMQRAGEILHGGDAWSEQGYRNGELRYNPFGDEVPKTMEGGGRTPTILRPDISFIERTSRAAFIKQCMVKERADGAFEEMTEKVEAVSAEDRAKMKEETGWSDAILDGIQSMEQYELLKNADLIEAEINGTKCLIKENIDLDYRDVDGVSNRERMERGLPPLDSKTGNPLELHHLGQKADSPLVELTVEEHRTGDYAEGKKNQSLWHDNTIKSEVHGEGNHWKQEREAHWKARAENRKG